MAAHEHGPPAERGLPGGERGLLHQLLHPPPHLLQPAERAGWFLLQNLIETFSPIHSGGRGADIYLKSEVSIPKKKGSFDRECYGKMLGKRYKNRLSLKHRCYVKAMYIIRVTSSS